MTPLASLPRSIGKVVPQALASENIHHLEDLVQFTEKQVLAMHGVGPKGFRILKEELAKLNLSFKAVE